MDTISKENRLRPREEVKVLYDHELKNAPGKSIIGLEIEYSPNGFTPPHRHGGATVVAFVTEGSILSGMNGNPPRVYEPGESFMELPGCHHTVAENNSKTQRAKLIVVLVVDTEVVKKSGYEGLTVLDDGWE
ncbi:cupin 2 [Talaromyces proteolyticus]|uniref:Cupin 2 n=1 Tax=Talaromyces proteolyticus TaxID=1131652 RepID=A0AAD4KVE0_9EURO|nr:cupin 2 [Talaromyces proteolyticus]KAH8697581.1 cupin 2 [Talaromyces proteolyticus]